MIPEEFTLDENGKPIPEEHLDAYYYERDWGASMVAGEIASFLGLPGHYSVSQGARVLMDFGRFPGPTPKDADHLHRFALNYPFSKLLSYQQKKRVFRKLL